MIRFFTYLLRWQLSTPILYLVVNKLGVGLWQTIIANLIGGAIFFWVDKFIFTSTAFEIWHIKEKGICQQCGAVTELRRLVKTKDYDKSLDKPIFLCKGCSDKKLEELKKRGIKTNADGSV